MDMWKGREYGRVFIDFGCCKTGKGGEPCTYKKGEIEQNTQKPIAVIPAYDYAIGNVANIMKQVEDLYQ